MGVERELDTRIEFFSRLEAEYDKAREKHGGWPDDVIHGSAILNEEAGKLTQACIDATYDNLPTQEGIDRMRKYAARVGAMALRFSEALQDK